MNNTNHGKDPSQEGAGYVCTCCAHYGRYGSGRWYGGAIVRILLALVVAFFIFALGVKVGEIKSELFNGYGYGEGGFGGFHRGYMMDGYGGYGTNGMMTPYGTAVPTVPPTAPSPVR